MRPVHIGAALVEPHLRGPEPDCVHVGHVSREVAYADLRLHHYLANLPEPPSGVIAIMQYRRMYHFGGTGPFDMKGCFLDWRISRKKSDAVRVPLATRPAHLDRLSRLRTDDLVKILGRHGAVMSRHNKSTDGLENAYIKAFRASHPDDGRYVDGWHAMRRVLETFVGKKTTDDVLDGSTGYFHNMMITHWDEFKLYTDFLFAVLAELEDYRSTPRLFGYLAERIQTVYVLHRQIQKRSFAVKHRPIMMFA